MAGSHVAGHDLPPPPPLPAPPTAGIRVGEGVFSTPQKAALANLPNTRTLNKAWAADSVLEQPERVIWNPQRIRGTLPRNVKARGAFLITTKQKPPASFGLDPFKGAGTAGMHPESWKRLPKAHQAVRKELKSLRKIFDQGVQISKHGCIYPHPSYCTIGEGDERKAHDRVMLALMRVRTVGQQDEVDQHTGWPNSAEIRHFYCHHDNCCNPLHLQLQPIWRARRRMYCGSSGQCDCGSQPPCRLPYSTSNWIQQEDLCSSAAEVELALAETFATCGLRLMNSEEVASLKHAGNQPAAKQPKRKAPAPEPKQKARKRAKMIESRLYQAAKKAATRVAKKYARRA